MTTHVLFLWFGEKAGGAQSKYWAWMPECPAVGTTVHVPLDEPDARGYTDLENTKTMDVWRVAWTCDGTPFWHAEVQLR